jgi:mannose-6-phosphate isomerase
MDLVQLPANLPTGLSYRGGGQLARFRGLGPDAAAMPQDWIASTVAAFGESTIGLTMLDSGRSLADVIKSDPLGFLGPEHLGRAGVDTQMLVKLLDAGQRLPVHVHPNDEFARMVMGRACGKTEAWFMLEPATVHVGFNRSVDEDELRNWVATQDVEAMFAALNPIKVPAGASVVVPAGLPHVIGEGAFLVEIQQPCDLSIFLEWPERVVEDPDTGYLGLGVQRAVQAVDRAACDPARIEALVVHASDDRPGVHDALTSVADPYFRLQRVVSQAGRGTLLDAGYSVFIGLSGQAQLTSATGTTATVRAGDTVLATFRAGALHVDGDAVLLRCRPPKSSLD